MSLLGMLQAVCGEVGLPEPSSVIASNGTMERQLLRIANRVLNDLSMYPWKQLERRGTITLVAGQVRYALAADLDSHVFRTKWNTNTGLPLSGPYSAQLWEEIQNGWVGPTIPSQAFRVSGYSARTLELTPEPTSSEAGQAVTYLYNSKNRVRPATWEQNTAYAPGDYAFYDGNYYFTNLGGTSGTNAPVHVSGNASDGGVTWTYTDEVYDEFRFDTDVTVLNESLLGLGVQWNYLASKNLPYLHLREKFERDIITTLPKEIDAQEIDMRARSGDVIDFFNVPQTGFGDV